MKYIFQLLATLIFGLALILGAAAFYPGDSARCDWPYASGFSCGDTEAGMASVLLFVGILAVAIALFISTRRSVAPVRDLVATRPEREEQYETRFGSRN
jgi:amino acid transporter